MGDEAICGKLVGTFSCILQRPLTLQKGVIAKSNSSTIWLPLSLPGAYLALERQLAHILFESNADARAIFTRQFIEQTAKAAKAHGVPIESFDSIREKFERLIDILERRRVRTLWGLLYPGSQRRMEEELRRSGELGLRAHDSFLRLMLAVDAGVPIEPGVFDSFRDLCENALKSVEFGNYGVTLIAARRLINQLVSQLLQESQAGGDSPKDKLGAFNEIGAALGTLTQEESANLADYVPSTGKGVRAQAKALAEEALAVDLRDPEQLEKRLSDAKRRTLAALEVVRERLDNGAMSQAVIDLGTTVEFDVIPETIAPVPMTSEDIQAAKSLREVLCTVRGLHRVTLEDYGTALNVSAYVERLGSRSSTPCFYADSRAKGFQLLLLVDRSTSMRGNRTEQVERARGIFAEALDLPFVSSETWGFQGPEDGEVLITKFAAGAVVDNDGVGGDTPLHVAIESAHNHLKIQPGGCKHLIVVTDGFPAFTVRGLRRAFKKEELVGMVRKEVLAAKRAGIHVTILVVGAGGKYDISAEEAQAMFGARRSWSMIDEGRLGAGIVSTVRTSFMASMRQ